MRGAPYNVSALVGYALYRVAIRRERPACRSASVECYSYCPKLSHFIGAQSEGSAPQITRPPLTTNLNHFYPVAERASSAKIPLDGILLGAAGIRSTECGNIRICTTKSKEQKPPCLKFLKVLRKLLSRSFLSRVRDSVPRSFPVFPPLYAE